MKTTGLGKATQHSASHFAQRPPSQTSQRSSGTATGTVQQARALQAGKRGSFKKGGSFKKEKAVVRVGVHFTVQLGKRVPINTPMVGGETPAANLTAVSSVTESSPSAAPGSSPAVPTIGPEAAVGSSSAKAAGRVSKGATGKAAISRAASGLRRSASGVNQNAAGRASGYADRAAAVKAADSLLATSKAAADKPLSAAADKSAAAGGAGVRGCGKVVIKKTASFGKGTAGKATKLQPAGLWQSRLAQISQPVEETMQPGMLCLNALPWQALCYCCTRCWCLVWVMWWLQALSTDLRFVCWCQVVQQQWLSAAVY
jgi:hypothetical protein